MSRVIAAMLHHFAYWVVSEFSETLHTWTFSESKLFWALSDNNYRLMQLFLNSNLMLKDLQVKG